VIASWWAAVAMLTRLPARSAAGDRVGSSWFGVAGGLVGAGGLVPLVVLGAVMPAAAAILAVGIMAVLSGALHLDGLADSADALLAIGPGAAERARKDPSIGVGGATALALVLGLEVVSLATLASVQGALIAGLACLVGGSASRAAPVIVAWAVRSRAIGVGLGAAFARQVTAADAVVATLTALAVASSAVVIACSPVLLIGPAVGLAAGVALGLGVVWLRRQLDGDGLGATVELSFAAIVLSTAAIGRWPAA